MPCLKRISSVFRGKNTKQAKLFDVKIKFNSLVNPPVTSTTEKHES